jgi:hypothetical protein
MLCRAVIPVVAVRTPPSPDALPFHPWCAAIQTDIFRDAGGRQHVRLRRGSANIQLAVSGISLLESPYLLTELVLPDDLARARLAAIGAFNRLSGRRIMAGPSSAEGVASQRLPLVLQALDGYLAGASQRQIAISLFGLRRVEQEWRDAGGHIRDCVRRAIGRGRHLMTAGYLELLRR